jgi:energy-coupling factor transport system ATP-binding protein
MQFPERQFFSPAVEDEVGFAAERIGLAGERKREALSRALASVGFENPADLFGRSPWAFSLGEQRRLALASILVANPRVLLLDEPAAGLDWAGRERLVAILGALATKGAGVLVVTHALAPFANVASSVHVIVNRRLTSVAFDPETPRDTLERIRRS